MPKRYIEVPEAIVLRDPVTKVELKNGEGEPESWDFGLLLNKLMANPKWAENFSNMRSQEAIEVAYEEAKSSGSGVMELAEEDWAKLRDAAETPKTQLNGPMGLQLIPGYGLHPSMGRQIIKLVAPIIDAKTERPKIKVVEAQALEALPAERA